MNEKLISKNEDLLFPENSNKRKHNKRNNHNDPLSNINRNKTFESAGNERMKRNNKYEGNDYQESQDYDDSNNNTFSRKKKHFHAHKKGKREDYDTLKESICTTLKRDLFRIWNKLTVVMFPINNKQKEKELRHWDLWGPFLFCVLLGL